MGDFGEGLQDLPRTVGYRNIVKIYDMVADGGRQFMTGSGKQPEEG